MNQLIELITKLAQSISAKFTDLTTKLSNGAFVVGKSVQSEQLVGGKNGKTYTVDTIDEAISTLDKNVDARIVAAKDEVSTDFQNQLSGLQASVDAELAKKATKDEVTTFKNETAQTVLDLKKTDADNFAAAKAYTDTEVGKVASDLGSFKTQIGAGVANSLTESKAYTDQQIDSIFSVNGNGVVDTIKEIVQVIGSDKSGMESLLSQLSKKASVADLDAAVVNHNTLDLFVKNLNEKAVATEVKADTLRTDVDSLGTKLYTGFSDAVKIIDGINI